MVSKTVIALLLLFLLASPISSAVFSVRSKHQADLTSEPMPRSSDIAPLNRESRGYVSKMAKGAAIGAGAAAAYTWWKKGK